jgi:FG-GAP-like repeat
MGLLQHGLIYKLNKLGDIMSAILSQSLLSQYLVSSLGDDELSKDLEDSNDILKIAEFPNTNDSGDIIRDSDDTKNTPNFLDASTFSNSNSLSFFQINNNISQLIANSAISFGPGLMLDFRNLAYPNGSLLQQESLLPPEGKFNGWTAQRSNGDFNSDGRSDLIWRKEELIAIWVMTDNILEVSIFAGTAPTYWNIASTGDFNGDRKTDILWRANDESVGIWQMDGFNATSTSLIAQPSNQWKIFGTGDFNGDSKSDILLRNNDGSVAIWEMNGINITSGKIITKPSADWKIAGVGDFDGDNKSDIAWVNNTESVIAVWKMDGSSISSTSIFKQFSPGSVFSILGVDDFNGDNRADILGLTSPQSTLQQLEIWSMDSLNFLHTSSMNAPSIFLTKGPDIQSIGDFDGDNRADLFRMTYTASQGISHFS